MLNDEKRTIEEAYSSATTTSDLRVEADRRGDADILIAAGWSMSRIGSALLRLHSEYDSAAHPAHTTAKDFGGDKKAAHRHNLHETALMLGRLKAMPSVREQVRIQALRWNMEGATDIAARMVQWWLCQVCPECHGTKFIAATGTGRLTARACGTCKGTGLAEIPCGAAGRRLANWMDETLHAGRRDISRRLRPV